MKKIFALALATVMSLTVLVGCGDKKDDSSAAGGADLNAVYTAMEEKMFEKMGGKDNSPMLDTMEGDMLENMYPGLSDLGLKQVLVKAPAITAVAVEFALAEANDADQAAKVAEIFQARIDGQVNGGAWYPESIEQWKNNATVVTSGNFVMMIAVEDNADYIEIFKAQCK